MNHRQPIEVQYTIPSDIQRLSNALSTLKARQINLRKMELMEDIHNPQLCHLNLLLDLDSRPDDAEALLRQLKEVLKVSTAHNRP